VHRFEDTQASAWGIIGIILNKAEKTKMPDALKIQKELVILRRRIPETNAGKALRYELM
jgi:hypothetical protein